MVPAHSRSQQIAREGMNADESEITWEVPGRALSTDMCLCSPPPSRSQGTGKKDVAASSVSVCSPRAPASHGLSIFLQLCCPVRATVLCVGFVCSCLLTALCGGLCSPVCRWDRGPAGQGADPGGVHLPQHSTAVTHRGHTAGSVCRSQACGVWEAKTRPTRSGLGVWR